MYEPSGTVSRIHAILGDRALVGVRPEGAVCGQPSLILLGIEGREVGDDVPHPEISAITDSLDGKVRRMRSRPVAKRSIRGGAKSSARSPPPGSPSEPTRGLSGDRPRWRRFLRTWSPAWPAMERFVQQRGHGEGVPVRWATDSVWVPLPLRRQPNRVARATTATVDVSHEASDPHRGGSARGR